MQNIVLSNDESSASDTFASPLLLTSGTQWEDQQTYSLGVRDR